MGVYRSSHSVCTLVYSNLTVQLYNLIILEGFIPLLIDGSDDHKKKILCGFLTFKKYKTELQFCVAFLDLANNFFKNILNMQSCQKYTR